MMGQPNPTAHGKQLPCAVMGRLKKVDFKSTSHVSFHRVKKISKRINAVNEKKKKRASLLLLFFLMRK